jgi:hypothetical protein
MRVARMLAWVCASVAALLCAPAFAETLARLTVTSFTLAADTPRPQVEEPFHVIITAHVRERITQLDNLNLPILAELELLGDERHWTTDGAGTTYREVITVVAHHTGTIHLSAATLDCIDARSGKPVRISSNELDLHVGGGAFEPVQTAGNALAVIGRVLVWLVFSLAGIASAILVLVFLFRRRKSVPAPIVADPPPPPVPVAVRTRESQLRDALLTLQAERSRPAAVRVRAAVWRIVGATDKDTLNDVLKHPQAQEPALREVLSTLERAAFTHDADFPSALDSAIAALERVAA